MLLYRISGTDTWVDWDVLHNDQGYSTWPCVSMTYKKISPWGTDGGSGYKDSQTTPFYFVSGNHGWLLAVSMPGVIGLYPSEATPLQMINGGVVSNAVTMDFLNDTWYLIEAEISNERYWLTESMVEELGWEVYEEGTYEFVFVDSTTGRVVHGVEQLDEMVFVEESAYPIVSKYEKTYDSQQTLADGAYIDTVLPYYPTKLYIASCADNTIHNQTWFGLSVSNEGGFVRVTNNTGATVTLNRLAIQSMDATDAEVVEVKDGSDNHAWAFKWDDSGTPYWYIEYHAERTWRDSLGEWMEVPVGPVLPTVSDTGILLSNGNRTARYFAQISNSNYADMSVSNNSNAQLYERFNYGQVYYKAEDGFIYSLGDYGKYDGTWLASCGSFTLSISNNEAKALYITNVSGGSISLSYIKCYSCSSNQATVITVYNSSNVAYNAFKYTLDGIDYYYVLDGTQTDWTDDLSSIGYSLTPAVILPTVEKFSNAYPTPSSAVGTYAAGGSGYLYEHSPVTRAMPYDISKVYSVYGYYVDSGWKRGRFFDAQNNGGIVKIVNITSSTISSIYLFLYATCSSNQATVIPVYNSSNTAYNAFKFTASGTDYYYVLDGTQTDWTDDLSSIGYRLDMQFYFYFRSDVSTGNPIDVTFDYVLDNNYWNLRVRNSTDEAMLSSYDLLYTNSSTSRYGNLLTDNSYAYELLGIYLPDDSDASFDLSDFYISGSTIIAVWCNSSYSTPVRSCLIGIKPIS